MNSRYIGRFAPSPTGPLHAGSLVAALASWLDARAHGGRWLVRIEDVDRPRCPPSTDALVLEQLARCGLLSDEPPLWQSQRDAHYAEALTRLQQAGWAYPCACSRAEIAQAQPRGHDRHAHRARHTELVYPGTCRHGLQGRPARAWRLLSTADLAAQQALPPLEWQDRRLGLQHQDLGRAVGDFVLKRADGLWAYQLAVVVDDALQGITDIVRGEDLADNTPRQLRLQALLGVQIPRYLHTPLVLGENGEKLSKQNGAAALNLTHPAATLIEAGQHLGLNLQGNTVADVLAHGVQTWRGTMMPASQSPEPLPGSATQKDLT
ncbi:tRNA glutamyl-Q(34) synthetase GluQRS [Roseateles koreensis]|uniref:Glutamyl-Q tRNA(Asp) synthetase n=1 Tax=Roseateles koreensis TaxID=2987526 RepID=A0ABT5KW55_9BURK|nr:tRNA glutamyl-Q(34) synthetase GluQRS [Roseateles koreensis]MDC8787179.1 tRNA glutamyl-Q(34) synthetase GluQRS [Roseateles koreensis]